MVHFMHVLLMWIQLGNNMCRRFFAATHAGRRKTPCCEVAVAVGGVRGLGVRARCRVGMCVGVLACNGHVIRVAIRQSAVRAGPWDGPAGHWPSPRTHTLYMLQFTCRLEECPLLICCMASGDHIDLLAGGCSKGTVRLLVSKRVGLV
jgi:hypothetical protein